MTKRLRSILPILGALVLGGMFMLQLQPVYAAPNTKTQDQKILDALGKAAETPFQSGGSGIAKKKPGEIVGSIVKVVLQFTGTVAFIIFLYGGFQWLTARGNDEQVKKAKSLLTNAVIGLIVIILAYSLTYYITDVLFVATQS